ncbi:cytidine deaminase [bacterium]|nr:MAG: cytidine deaminase [bacterium]
MNAARDLLEAARAVRARAYAPYSSFPVGAAVEDERGRVYVGCNVENASFAAGLCAERAAIAAAVADGAHGLRAVAIAGSSPGPTMPCGICRQVLIEFGDPVVYASGLDESVHESRAAALLPDHFGPRDLGRP